jgi:phenylpropionate dioxygenase-like ring-hydroxylating dioxygenase large terminal subunit
MNDRTQSRFDYAEPHKPIDYERYHQAYSIPIDKGFKQNVKMPERDLGTARARDKERYYSKACMDLEGERLWPKVWILAGHLTDIPRKDCHMTFEVGHESFLIVRGAGKDVRAMYNFCQHRGAQLVNHDFGCSKRFVCPFHKWEYANTGVLTCITDRETFRKEALAHDLNLKPVRCEVWRDWVFINMDLEAQSLTDFLGPEVIQAMAPYDFEGAIRIRDVVQEWPANWKTAHENFNEGYHVQATHPELWPVVDTYHSQYDLYRNGHSRGIYPFMKPLPSHIPYLKAGELREEHKLFLREAGVKDADFPKHWKDVPAAIIKAKRKVKGGPINYAKFSDGQLTDDWGVGLFPTHEFFLHPEGFLIQAWLPHPSDPEKCIYRAQVYAVPGIGELPTFMGVKEADLSGKKVLPRTYAHPDYLAAAGPVVSQDLEIVPRVQRGLHSRGFHGAVYSEQEIRIRDFFEEYYKYLRDEKS